MPLMLLLWTVGSACVLAVVAVHVGLHGELWSSRKPTGKMGLNVLNAVAKCDVSQNEKVKKDIWGGL